MRHVFLAALLFSLAAMSGSATLAEDLGIRAPEGFEVSLYADDNLAHDINSMTIDSKGRVVVAGQGYVKILHDTDNDDRADEATLFSEFPKSGAHGLLFLGNDLIATGDNLVMRLRDADGDGVADGKPIPLANVKSPEHGANGLVQGPDGWIYMSAGNDGGIGAQFAKTKTSPVKKPQAGAVVRFSPDFKTSEIFAHGFRNPYDLTFNANGQLFTVDSDGERDQYLPWYTPTRLFDIQQGMHHGWVQRGWTRSWNRPEYFFDNVQRLVEIGRGSPTGVECYQHYAFPSHYRGGIYSCCWTLGTVYYFPLERDGASYKSHKEIFLQTTGDVGFAPVDLVVGPEGDMFVAIGGRGTRGSVFRIRYTGKLTKKELPPEPKDDLARVLTAPQPLAAWSRAKWLPLAEKLGEKRIERAALSDVYTTYQRVRATEVLTELHDGMSADAFDDLTHDNERVDARAIWSAGRRVDSEKFLSDVIYSAGTYLDEGLRRTSWETLARFDPKRVETAAERWRHAANGTRRIQAAALQVAADPSVDREDTILTDIESISRRTAILKYRGMHSLLRPEDFGDVLQLLNTSKDLISGAPKEKEYFVYELEERDSPLPNDHPFHPDRIPKLRKGIAPPTSLADFLSRDDWLTPAGEPRVPTLRRDVDDSGERDDRVERPVRDPDEDLFRRLQELADGEDNDDLLIQWRIDFIRMLQHCLGDVKVAETHPDVYSGYAANAPDKVDEADRRLAAKKLNKLFPQYDENTNREIARTIGMLEVEGEAVEKFAEKLTHRWNLKTSVEDDIHYLIVLSRLPGERTEGMTNRTAAGLSFLHMKMLVGEMNSSRNWPLRVGEMFQELCKRDPNLAEALATERDFDPPAHRDFGLPAHAMFAKLMPEKERKIAARRLLERAIDVGDKARWTPELIEVVAELRDGKALNAIREQWEDFQLRDAIIAALYQQPRVEDRELFLEALHETNAATVARAAEALSQLGEAASPDEIATVLSTLRHYGSFDNAGLTRVALAAAFKSLSNQSIDFAKEDKNDPLRAYKGAFDWFAKAHPVAAAKMNKLSALDGVDWQDRLAKIDWRQGEAVSGEKLFESRSCGKCHSGRNRLGPGLEGVTGRWSREDLMKEIVDPNRNVAPQFLTSRLETADGKVYQGVPIYESPDGTLLQTGPNETVRIAGPEIVSISKSRTSLMPTGLLRGMSDQEVADLYAYLKTLAVQRQ